MARQVQLREGRRPVAVLVAGRSLSLVVGSQRRTKLLGVGTLVKSLFLWPGARCRMSKVFVHNTKFFIARVWFCCRECTLCNVGWC